MQRMLVLLLLTSLTFATQAADPVLLELGSPAPDFSLPGVDGKTYSLNDFAQSKILAMVFTCNHCPTAIAYEERLKKIAEEYGPKGVAIVAINPNNARAVRLDELGYTDLGDSLEEMKIRAAHKKFNFPYIDDGDKQDLSKACGVKATPHVFIFDADRKLRYSGRIDDNEREEYAKVPDMRNALDALLAGKEVEVKQTKAMGCSTKWMAKEETVKAYNAKLAAEPVTLEPADEEVLKGLRKNETGKLRLVNFWATTCGPCITEFPDLVTINRMYRGRAFELVTVASNFPDEQKEVLDFLQKKQASCKNLIFGGTDKYKLAAAFDPDWDAALPYTMLIGTKNEIIYKKSGPFDVLELRRAIVKALRELNQGRVMDEPKKKK